MFLHVNFTYLFVEKYLISFYGEPSDYIKKLTVFYTHNCKLIGFLGKKIPRNFAHDHIANIL